MNEGTECKLTSCPQNYFVPLEHSSMTCKSSNWDSSISCVLSQNPCAGNPPTEAFESVDCPSQNIVSDVSPLSYFDGTRCEFECNAGYTVSPPSNSPQVQCSNGVWANPSTCVEGKSIILFIKRICF